MVEKLIKYPPENPEQRLIWETFFLVTMLTFIAVFGRNAATNVLYTIIISLLFGINLIIRFLLINEKGDGLFYLFGVIAGGGNDLMSMVNGVYRYTSITIIPLLSGLMPFWMILFWGQIFLVFRKIFNISWCKGEEFKKEGILLSGWIDKKLIFDIVLVIILRLIIYNTYMLDIWIPTLFYAIGIGLRFLIFPPKRNELLLIAILPYAFIFEGLLVLFGLYIYYNPVLLGMPLWLYLWWIFLVPFVLKEFFDRLEYFLEINKKKKINLLN